MSCTAAIAVVLVVSAAYIGLVNFDTFVTRNQQVASDSQYFVLGGPNRLLESLDALAAFTKSPLIGHGLGYQSKTLFPMGDSQIAPNLYIVHNFYLFILVKFGLLGVPIWIYFFVCMIKLPMNLCRRHTAPFPKFLCAGVAGLVVSLLVESIAAPRFCDKTATALLSIVFCLLLSTKELASSASHRDVATFESI
jgi:O-antigen ligase